MYFSVEKPYERHAMMSVMEKKKLSQKERNESVTKGYLEDQDYVTKEYFHDTLEATLDKKDYATKDYVGASFEAMDLKFQGYMEDSRRHMTMLMEDNRHQIRLLMEGTNARFERIERHVGLEPWAAK